MTSTCPCHRSASRARGFTLIEVMAVVTLAAALAALAGEAFVTITSVTRDCNRAQTNNVRLDAIVRLIRADAWRAVSVQTPDLNTVVLGLPGSQRVTWNISPNGTVSRRVGSTADHVAAETNRFEGFQLSIRFSTRDGDLVVASTQHDSGVDQLVFVSQLKLAARRGP